MKTDIILYLEKGIEENNLIFNGDYIPELLSKRFLNSDKIGSVYFSIPESYDGKIRSFDNVFVRENEDNVAFWKDLFEKTKSEHIAKIFVDSPFVELKTIEEMVDLHVQYLAEFTYSENLPAGLTCEIFSKELIEATPSLDNQTLSLNGVVKANINQFDIELYYRSPDIRDKRITFRSSNARDLKIMENIYNQNNTFPKYEDIKTIIEDNPSLLHISPSYVQIELTTKTNQTSIYSISSKEIGEKEIDEKTYDSILAGMNEFNLPYTIAFSGSGESMLHPSFYNFLEKAISESLVERIIVETNGILADLNYSNFVESKDKDKIVTIVSMNGLDSTTYKGIHNSDDFDKVLLNLQNLKKLYAENSLNLFIEVMKINETESYLDKFYDFWEMEKISIILQKQNSFIGELEDRSYSDLSPLVRTPCWHLQRDLVVLADGNVAFCKQDYNGENKVGSLAENSIFEIWNSKEKFFLDDYKLNYCKNPDCEKCDEWYTFNF